MINTAYFDYFISSVWGASVASFLCCLAEHPLSSLYRLSVCDGCGQNLHVRQLIPIFSSFCQIPCSCGHRPLLSYSVKELILALVFLINTLLFGFRTPGFLLDCLAMVGFYISLVDWKTKTIPIFPLMVVGFLGGVWAYDKTQIPWAALVVLLPLIIIPKRQNRLGSGDLILFVFATFWLKLEALSLFLFLTGFGGIITAWIYQGKLTFSRTPFPFAPAIFIALWLTLLVYNN